MRVVKRIAWNAMIRSVVLIVRMGIFSIKNLTIVKRPLAIQGNITTLTQQHVKIACETVIIARTNQAV